MRTDATKLGAGVRRRWQLGVELGLLAAAAATVALLSAVGAGGSQTAGSAPTGASPAPPGPPPPPPAGAFVVAKEDGALGVALAVRPAGATLKLTGTVQDQNGFGVSGLRVSFSIPTGGGQRKTLAATACGSGCYQATTDVGGRPASVSVELADGSQPSSSVSFLMPPLWPPAPAAAAVHRAAQTILHLHSLVTHERLASDPKHVVFTTYFSAAPNRLRFNVKGGDHTIIIGNRRWDRTPPGPWNEAAQEPITQPYPAWGANTQVTNAYRLGTTRVHGTRVWAISFATPGQHAWFTIWVDSRTYRTLELRMTAPAHFMHHTYSSFNEPFRIEPPTGKPGSR